MIYFKCNPNIRGKIMAARKSKATGTKSRITAEQAKNIAARFSKKAPPMDAEDKVDHGVDEATENDGGKLKFGSPEWRAKYSKKSKTVADALSAPGGK